jgi:photosystem II stability/assembly factor-like uncharacterized protein
MKAVQACTILLLIPSALLAGPNRWTTTGPGATAVSRIYVSPTDANTAFAWTPTGIFKTADAGQNWRRSGERLFGGSLSAFTVAHDGTLFAAANAIIFMSDDAGEQWSQRGSPGSVFVTALAFDPVQNRLILGTGGVAGIYTSADRGTTWRQASIPNISPGRFKGVSAIALSATAAYATAVIDDAGLLLRSSDGGQTWSRISISGQSTGTYAAYADPSSPWVYAKPQVAVQLFNTTPFYVSKDEGNSWTKLPLLSGTSRLVPAGSSLFIATSGGVFEYDDGAAEARAIGPDAVHDLAVSSMTPRLFYAAPESGVLTSSDGDPDWIPRNAGLPGPIVSDVDLSQIQPSTAYATMIGGVFRTDDAGQSWTALSRRIASPGGAAEEFFPYGKLIAVSPATPNTAYLSGGSGSSTGVFKTADAGATWKKVSPNFGVQLAISPSDPATLYAALASGMSTSSDGGETWSLITSDLSRDTLDFYYGFYVSSIAVDPGSASNVTIAKFSGIFKTNNGGSHWSQASIESDARALTIDPSDPATFYAAKRTTGLIRSSDGGTVWTSLGLSDKFVNTIALGGSILFAGTNDGHIYRSDDRGNSWTGFDDGMVFGNVRRVVVDAKGEHLFAATNAGVYAYDIVNQDVTPQRLTDGPRRFPSLFDAIGNAAATNAALIVPVTGTIRGAGGTLYTTQLTLINRRQTPQTVVITRLPREGESEVAEFTLTIAGTTDRSGGVIKLMDIAERLGSPGLGSLVIMPVDGAGNLDPSASISASTLIWSFPPGGLAPISQTIPSANAASFSAHAHARMSGLQQDSQFRANIGVVNLSADAHQFTIQVTGERASGQTTIEVPAFSLVQLPIPEGDYGRVTIDAFADGSGSRWVLYGSSINQATRQAQTILGDPVP